MEYNKKVLDRAHELLKSSDISEVQILRLANAMNEYIDFVGVINSVGADDNMIEIEKRLAHNIDSCCDKIQIMPARRLS